MNELRQDISFKTDDDLIAGLNIVTSNALVPANTAFKRGDLVAIDEATNELSHMAAGSGYSGIMVLDITAEQATSHAQDEVEVPIYTQGTFNPFECKINGTKLTKAQRLSARAYANKNLPGIELHMPHGVEDV